VPDSAGLGLFIARGLVELHGGLITVDSEESVFTEFTVLLPRTV
jgi:signal transduction histidine kinase